MGIDEIREVTREVWEVVRRSPTAGAPVPLTIVIPSATE